jgi:hypothetical protein
MVHFYSYTGDMSRIKFMSAKNISAIFALPDASAKHKCRRTRPEFKPKGFHIAPAGKRTLWRAGRGFVVHS